MNVLRKALSTLGGILLAALLLAALVPRAARGVAAALVQITNTTANPVPGRDVDNPARHAFLTSCTGQSSSGDASCTISVPAGQQLVIQGATFRAFLNPVAGQLVQGAISTTVNESGAFIFVALQDLGLNFGLSGTPHEYVGSLPYTVYADPDTQLSLSVFLGSSSESVTFDATISGYLVSVP